MKTVFEFIQEQYTDRPLFYNTLVYDNDLDLIVSDQFMADSDSEIRKYQRMKQNCYRAAENSHNSSYGMKVEDDRIIYTFEFGIDDVDDPDQRWEKYADEEPDSIEYVIMSNKNSTTGKREYFAWAPSSKRFDQWYSTQPIEFADCGCSCGAYDSIEELFKDVLTNE